MTLQNRVQPDGQFIAHPARGAFMGNRGILHDENQNLRPARWRHKAWVTCVLDFKNRKRAIMGRRTYTELFFHDEAVAFAAGHRPCAECRRADYLRFRDTLVLSGKIGAFDDVLHDERVVPRRRLQRHHQGQIETLPDGAFILSKAGQPMLVIEDVLRGFSPTGYGAQVKRPQSGTVTVLTPPSLLRALRQGYRLDIHLP